MIYFGRVKDGKVVPEPGVHLVEGAIVRIEPVEAPTNGAPQGADSADDAVYRLGELAVDDGGPPDVAAQHDHYIYGTPKRRRPGG